jgi:hypothetical protein
VSPISTRPDSRIGVSPISSPRGDSRRRADQTESGLEVPEQPVAKPVPSQNAPRGNPTPSMSAEEALRFGGTFGDLEQPAERLADSVASHLDKLLGRDRNFPRDES